MKKIQSKKRQGKQILSNNLYMLACYEDAEFYHRFSMAMQQADQQGVSGIEYPECPVVCFFGIGSLLALLIGIKPFLLLFVVLQVSLTFVLDLRMVKKQHELMEQRMPHQRKAEYIRRV